MISNPKTPDDHVAGSDKLKGSDVDGEIYPVIKGIAVDLVLNKGEIAWLRRAWAEATGSSRS